MLSGVYGWMVCVGGFLVAVGGLLTMWPIDLYLWPTTTVGVVSPALMAAVGENRAEATRLVRFEEMRFPGIGPATAEALALWRLTQGADLRCPI
jgi:hypothetical protein